MSNPDSILGTLVTYRAASAADVGALGIAVAADKVTDAAQAKTVMDTVLGLSDLLYREEQLENSLKDPAKYITDRKTAIAAIDTGTEYKEQFDKLPNTIPVARRKKIATELTDAWLRTQLALVNERFPTKFVESAVDNKVKRNAANLALGI